MKKIIHEDKVESIRLQIQILIEEYKTIRENVHKHLELKTQMDIIALTGLGLSIPLMISLFDINKDIYNAVLLIPIIFLSIVFLQLRHERLLSICAIYIDKELLPKMEEIISELSDDNINLLGFEQALSRKGWSNNLLIEWLGTISHSVLGLIFGIGIFDIYIYLRINVLLSPWNTLEYLLIGINILILLFDLLMAFIIAQNRYLYLLKYK
jgi:hypothetical protein